MDDVPHNVPDDGGAVDDVEDGVIHKQNSKKILSQNSLGW